MILSKYRELRKQDTKDRLLKKRLEKYNKVKSDFRHYMIMFNYSDDLFDLVKLMRVGNKILEREGFPLREFYKYKFKNEK